MSSSVLVLNASYEPLRVVSIKRAVILLLQSKAELVEAAEQRLRAQGTSMGVFAGPPKKVHYTQSDRA